MFMPHRLHIQVLFQIFRTDHQRFLPASGKLHCRSPAQCIKALLQSSDTAFHRIAADDRPDCFVRNLQPVLRNPHGLLRSGEQVPDSNLILLAGGIAAEFNDLHPVEQRLRNGVRCIRCTDEQDIAQIIGHIHVVVRKGVVLFRIQHFQQSAGRVAVVGHPELVHFIQYNNRIGSPALLDPVHDSARHRSDIGSPVSADVCFIPHTAQADTYILPLQRSGNGAADAGLSGTRCTDKQQDGTGLFPVQVHDRNLLQDPVLDLFQSVMIFIQNPGCPVDIDPRHPGLLPVQAGQEIQIVVQIAVFRAVLPLLPHSGQHLVRFLPGRFIHSGILDLLLQHPYIRYILRMHLIELALEVFQLFLDGLFTVELLGRFFLFGSSFIRQCGDFNVLVENLLHHLHTLALGVFFQNAVFFPACQIQPLGDHGHDFADRTPLHDPSSGHGSPLVGFRHLQDGTLQTVQLLLLFFKRKIIYIRPADYRIGFQHTVRPHAHGFYVHPGFHIEHRKAGAADIPDRTGYTDRPEVITGVFSGLLLLLCHDKDRPLSGFRIPAGRFAVEIILQVHPAVRKHQASVNRNDYRHGITAFLLSLAFYHIEC